MMAKNCTNTAPGLQDDLKLRAEKVAAVAAEHADDVDRAARFPAETFAAAREQRLLGLLVPPELGGDGATVADVADICFVLGRACASSGMIFAMHQIMAAILVRHRGPSGWLRRMLERLGATQLLLASSTTEGQGGGDLRASACAVEQNDGRITLEKSATVLSYGAYADAVLTTARRAPDALPSDQVLVALLKDDYQLTPIMDWDTLGMRGTCSSGFALKGRGMAEQVLPVPYQTIQSQTMMPVAHLTWTSVWSGLAAGAVERARRFVRVAARKSGGQMPPGAAHLTRAAMTLRTLRALVAEALEKFENCADRPDELEALEFQNAMNLLKVSASELAIATVMSCTQACGLLGYRNDGEFSVSRHVRDVLSSAIMINNDRIVASAAAGSMLVEAPHWLRS